MRHDNDIQHGRHCLFKMHGHWVFVAKCRRKVFDGDAIDRLRIIFAKTCADFEAQLIEMAGEDDHVHPRVSCGRRPTLRRVAAAPQSPSCGRTSNNNRRRTEP